jgi:hypothetical protein
VRRLAAAVRAVQARRTALLAKTGRRRRESCTAKIPGPFVVVIESVIGVVPMLNNDNDND